MNILELLHSKPHNTHWVHRYYRFINLCSQKNYEVGNKVGEIHHICPKSKDLFPEYRNLKAFPWNSVLLTYRQHFLAHWMLWKAYGGSQIYAFYAMNSQSQSVRQKNIKGSRIYSSVKKEVCELARQRNLGYAGYVDSKGIRYRVRTDDPRVLSGELVSLSQKGGNIGHVAKNQD